MNDPVIPLDEFDYEMAVTRRLLERVPSEKGEWRPHEKSFSLGHLAQLVSWMPGWITNTLTEPDLDLGGGPAYSYESTETLLAGFDRGAAEARAALEATSGDTLQETWSLKHAGRVLMSMPRGAVTRQNLNHLIHHRGQLTVYLRLLDVPIPSIYGPTADEPWSPDAE